MADPITEADVWAGALSPIGYISLQQKLIAGAKSYAFSVNCQCNSASDAPCTTVDWVIPAGTTGSCSYPGVCWYSGVYQTAGVFPSGQHKVRVTIPGVVAPTNILFEMYSNTSGEQGGPRGQWNAGTAFDITWNAPVASAWWNFVLNPNSQVGSWLIGKTMHIEYSNLSTESPCTGPPTTPPAPAVPSLPNIPNDPTPTYCADSDVCATLARIESRLKVMDGYTQLIQRQVVPFAYLRGTPVAVSGQGSTAVQGILGVSLSLTDSRSGVGNYPDNPTSYFDLGWLTFGTADGYLSAHPIRRLADLVLDVSPAVTTVHWSLPSGVSGTLTPLVRES